MSSRLHLALAVTVTVLILVACWIPGYWLHENPLVHQLGHADKLVHGTMFAFFGIFWTLGDTSMRRLPWVIAAGVGLAIVTEVVQGHPLIMRDPDPLDGLADVLGMVVGIAASRFLIPALVRAPILSKTEAT